MSEEPDTRALTSAAKNRRCAQCYGPVVVRWREGVWAIECPRGCKPGGHVSAEYAEQARQRDLLDTEKVLASYPELRPTPLADDPVQAKETLFGDGTESA